MTPDILLAEHIREQIKLLGFNWLQVVAMHDQAELILPRAVVVTSCNDDATLAQAAIFPCAVSVEVIAEARQDADIRTVSHEIELMMRCLQSNRLVAVLGVNLGAIETTFSDDRISRKMAFVIFARLLSI